MFNRCKFCSDIIPHYCEMCNSCFRLEGKPKLTTKQKKEIKEVVQKVTDEYGDVLRKLGNE